MACVCLGKLLRSRDLERLARFMALFYDEMPVDFLYDNFYRSMGQQTHRISCQPSLFQHFGDHSTFARKKPNRLKDEFFVRKAEVRVRVAERLLLAGNPPAELCTSLEAESEDTMLQGAYESAGQYFRSSSPPKVNDTLTIIFREAQAVDSIELHSGNDVYMNEFLRGAIVLVSPLEGQGQGSQNASCNCPLMGRTELGRVISGNFKQRNVYAKVGFKVKCVQIKVTISQEELLVVGHIRVTAA